MTKHNSAAHQTSPALQPVTRRRFLAGAEANSEVDIGLIGCGGRGQSPGSMFVNTGGYNMVAVADY